MACNIPFFKKQFEYCKLTYAKDILEGKYENIDFWGYTASTDGKYHINKKKRLIEVPSDDTIYGTYDKSTKAIKTLISQNIEFDYIFRTNCSTYINVELLNQYVNIHCVPDKIYSGSLICSEVGCGPYDWSIFACGNSMLLSRKWIQVLLDNNVEDCRRFDRLSCPDYDKTSIYTVDDNAFGTIINTYLYSYDISPFDTFESFPMVNYCNDKEHLHDNITISVRDNLAAKDYWKREHEYTWMQQVHAIISERKKYDIHHIMYDYQQCIHIMDFRKNLHSLVSLDWGFDFMKIMNPYINAKEMNKLKQN